MKTERRHELHRNALAAWIEGRIDALRPYGRMIAGLLIGLIVIVGVAYYLGYRSTQTREVGWQRYFQASDILQTTDNPDVMVDLAQSPDYAGTEVSYWANLALADFYFSRGVNDLFNDRAAARTALQSAQQYYTQVSEQTELPSLAERATMGLARTYESLNELERARAAYESIESKWPDGMYAFEAKARLEALGKDSTKQFYDWFFATTPPRLPTGPGSPGGRIPFGGDLPDESLFDPPRPDSGLTPDTPASPDNGASPPAGETPTTPAEPPASPQGDAPAAPPGESPNDASDAPVPDTAAPDTAAPESPPSSGAPESAPSLQPPAVPMPEAPTPETPQGG